ncbi:hypothetical protein H8F21_15275 [Pseudomonas sp. P66]|uniref:Uncharacterized protein n=1 Tax=Pseudomonas arcuscaelestis TaxID=2710591 RepID=A0ABS2BZ65_9PSED|nr:hypothetical protein [Pseudomonas arcuscaelestis]MBM5458927.1 hypothetical protein [Pseudomonas arcuscaelestis]
MRSSQINTSPLLRNFATLITTTSIQVSTKLGSQTVLRAEFSPSTYPDNADQQLMFLSELIARTNPGALDLLKDVAERCIDDQRKAIANLMGSGSATPQTA